MSRFRAASLLALALAVLGLAATTSRQARRLPHRIAEEGSMRRSHRYDQPDAAAEFFRRKRVMGSGGVPAEKYVEAAMRMRELPRHSTVADRFLPSVAAVVQGLELAPKAAPPWQALGPGNIGGRTRALLVDPTNPNIMFAGAVAGGVWRSEDGGSSWSPLTDFLSNIAVSTLAFRPGDSQVIYAGTGEGYFNIDSVRGAGIFTSFDGGNTWARMPGTDGDDFHYVNKIVIGPASGVIYAATGTGVWQYDPSGQSWAHRLDPKRFGGCLDLAAREEDGHDTVFASCGNFVQAAVYEAQQADGGGAFAVVLEDPDMGRTSLAIAPSNPQVIYALAAEAEILNSVFVDGLHGVFRSTSGGGAGTWVAQVRNTDKKKLNTLLLSNPVEAELIECGFAPFERYLNQGWYDNVIAVDPTNPNRVWVGGVDLFRSDDGGANWGVASYWWGNPGQDVAYAHADQHAIVFPPAYDGATNQTILFGNDGGIFRVQNALAPTLSDATALCDPSKGQVDFAELNHGYAATQFYNGAVFPGSQTYFGGTQDNGTVLGTDKGGANGWNEIYGGDGGWVAVSPNKTGTLFVENTGVSLAKTIDGGHHFFDATKGIFGRNENFLFIVPFAMDPRNPRILWIGGSHMFRTTNGATSWQRASAPVIHGLNAVSAVAISPVDSNVVMIGNTAGSILHTDHALSSGSQTQWPGAQPRRAYVSSVTFQPGTSKVAYATYSTFGGDHVFKTTDGGNSWTSMGAASLPDTPANTVAVDPRNPQNVYLGTDSGVFFSADGGNTWTVETNGFPNTRVEYLTVEAANDGSLWLYAFTHGRSAWRVQLP